MSTQDRIRWDQIHRERAVNPFPPPDPLLLAYAPHSPIGMPRRALDLAAGFGQNGLWLAEQGYIVDLLDISRVALSVAQQEATRRKLRLVNLLQVDLDEVELDEQLYDVVCAFRYLNLGLMESIKASILPGGLVIYETFNTDYLKIRPDFNPRYLVASGELAKLFAGWEILHEFDDDQASQLVARKPI